ncbi:MAG: flavodoxin family protein [bacterium]
MEVLGIYGSPRENGNTDVLLDALLEAAVSAGAKATRLYLRKLRMLPCMEDYGCREGGRCTFNDDFDTAHDLIDAADAVVLATPIFFYSVSAHSKILIDRCQSFWIRKYELKRPIKPARPGVLIAAGATKGKKLFDGVLLTVRYFFDAIDVELSDTLLVKGVDEKGDIEKFPDKIEKARAIGKALAEGGKSA